MIYYNANLVYSIITRRSIIGVIACISKIPVIIRLKCLLILEALTYSAKFNVGRPITKDSIKIRHILYSLDVKVNNLTKLYRYNKVVHTSIVTDNDLYKKKYTIIAFNKLCKAIVAGII